MKYFKKKAASSWSSFKKKTDTGGGEKRYFLGPPTDQDLIDLDLIDNGKQIKISFNGSRYEILYTLFEKFKFYRYIKESYCYPEVKVDIDDSGFLTIIDALYKIVNVNETFEGKITNDGSRIYIVSSDILKQISKICPPEISGIFLTQKDNENYDLNIYFENDFLSQFNMNFDFFNFQNDLNFASISIIFHENTINSGLLFDIELISRYIASLCTKPFVICSGLSGSGKTKLAQAFAQWISADKLQYEIVPVGADWTNREPLLGYPNALNKEEYICPENGVLDLLIRAKNE
jgi:hypothetical protein